MWHAELFLLLVQCHSVTNITDTETQNSKINTNILNRNAGYCACSGPENSFTLPIRSEQLEDPRLYFRLPSSFKGLHIRLRTERPGFDFRTFITSKTESGFVQSSAAHCTVDSFPGGKGARSMKMTTVLVCLVWRWTASSLQAFMVPSR